MKKRKFNFIIDIAVLCLCVAAIAIGVYSAKQATLNVSGTIGFNAHDCEVAVSGVMNAYTQNANGTNDAVVKYFNKTEAEGGEANIVKGTGSTNTWDIGSVCFDDLNVDKYHYVNDISFTFTITNNSAFYVDVTVDQKCINNDRIFIYAPNNGETLAPKGQDGSSVTLIVKIQLEKDANGEYSALPSALDLTQASPLLNFQKSQAPAYLSKDWKTQITNTYGISDIKTTTKVSFLREINDTLLTNYDKNVDGTYKTVSVGAVNENSTAGNLTENVSDVTAYYNSTNNEIIIYSPARIYAPQSCKALFRAYTKLTSIVFSNFDTSKTKDMGGMFSGRWTRSDSNLTLSYMSLKNLDITSFDTSNVSAKNDFTQMFAANIFKTLDLRNFNTSQVVDMAKMFYFSTNLKTLELRNFDTSKVTTMQLMFGGYEDYKMNITDLDLKSFNTSNVENFGSMFQRCSVLESLNIENFDTSKATTFDGMFLGCSALKNIIVNNFNTSGVTNMRAMFDECSSLKLIDLSHFDTSNVTNMSLMFYGCSSLNDLNISNFDTSKVTNMAKMFSRCGNLTTIYVGAKWNTSAVTDSAEMFAECTVLVGANGTSYANMLTTDADNAKLVKYAVVDTESTPGYLTHI